MSCRRIEAWVLLAANLIYCLGAYRLVCLPEGDFAANVIIDDALYFLVPAQHLIAGEGFSFDGVYLTNGVQTLWALVTVGLAWLVPDTLTAMRAMSLVSGLCWLVAGMWLYRGLIGFHRGIALFVTCGWLMSAFTNRVAFQGMENGLHGLLFAMIVVAGMRLRHAPPRFVGLGILFGLFALARTETALLAMMMCVAIFLGFLHPADRAKGRHWGPAFRFGLPVLILIGGVMLGSFVWFDSATPVSGRVKMFYENTWGRETAHGTPLPNLVWHVKFLRSLILAPMSDNASDALLYLGIDVAGSKLRQPLLLVYLLGLASLAIRAWRRRASGPSRSGNRPVRNVFAVMALFLIAHVVMMALLLPHFTGYGTWYFAAEFLGLWLFAGWVGYEFLARLSAVVPRWRRPLMRAARVGIPICLLAASVPRLINSPIHDPPTVPFLKAARWLNSELPAGQRIGSLSAGLVAAFADQHTVYNLDGLISSREYFEDYLVTGRVHEFFARENIRYFADSQTLDDWRTGISWCGNLPLERLRLQRWWRLDNGLAYAIWEVLPVGQTHQTLSGSPMTADPLAELRFAAEVLGEFEVIETGTLEAVLASGTDKVLITSIALEPSGELRHVMVSPR